MFPSVNTPLTLEVNYFRGVLLLNYNWHIQVNFPLSIYPDIFLSPALRTTTNVSLTMPFAENTLARWQPELPSRRASKPSSLKNLTPFLFFPVFHMYIIKTHIVLKVYHGYFPHLRYSRNFH
jgi:hypothetical protein